MLASLMTILSVASWQSGTPTKFVNPHSNLCMDLAAGSAADGTPLQLWHCNGRDPQRFVAKPSGDWQQITTLGFQKCLNIEADGSATQRPCAANDAQLVRAVPGPGNTVAWQFRDGRCLDVPNGSQAPGTPLRIWACNGSPAQAWAPLESTFDDGRAYGLTNAQGNNCVDDWNWGVMDGNPVRAYGCSLGPTQGYTFNFMGSDDSGAGFYQVINLNSAKCLDVTGVSTDPGAPIQLFSCLGGGQTNQHWQVVPANGGGYTLQARHSGQMLDLQNGSSDNGTVIQQFPANGAGAQRWVLTATHGGMGSPDPGYLPVLGDIGNGGDPGIAYWGGYFHYTMSGFGNSFSIARSPKLNTVLTADAGFFTWNNNTEAQFHAESPEPAVVVDPRNGQQKLAIYVTDALPYPGRVRVVLWGGPDQGFEDMGYLANVGGYDAHYMAHPNGHNYLLYSTFDQVQIIELSTPWSTVGGPVAITRATYPWELQEGAVINEAPTHVIAGNTVNLVYTANWVDHATYQCGLATASVGDDPTRPESWTKHTEGPVFAPAQGLYGIGSGNFVFDGSTVWWSYQAVNNLAQPVRRIHSQGVWFDQNGVVQLGQPH